MSIPGTVGEIWDVGNAFGLETECRNALGSYLLENRRDATVSVSGATVRHRATGTTFTVTCLPDTIDPRERTR